MRPKIYSYDVVRKIEEKIPKSIIEAMSQKGWNALGIYEVVVEELRAESKRNKIND